MISRRNIRVKAMQSLYCLDTTNGESSKKEAAAIFNKKLEQTKELYIYLLHFIAEVARYAEKDAAKKAGKHLPTAEDLAINTKLAGNTLLWKMLGDDNFENLVRQYKAHLVMDEALVKKMYVELVKAPIYQDYILEQSRDKSTEKKMLLFILNDLLLPSDDFIQHVEEHFINWDDDAEMMQSLVQNYFNRPTASAFEMLVSDEKVEFGRTLVATFIDKYDHTKELIKPKLKNWDADRIASLDLIILQLGVCELLYFETIPTKVTINEYIDLAKDYSTAQSGHFVNGLLDTLHKELDSQDKIHKKSFRNSTL